jgi:hypothetical protein
MEQNVWNKFDSAINGHQGLLKAKVESNSFFKEVNCFFFEQVLATKRTCLYTTVLALTSWTNCPRNSSTIFSPIRHMMRQFRGELSYVGFVAEDERRIS